MSASLQHEHGGSGGFIFTNYSFDRFHHLGLRYDRVDHEDEEKNTVSLIGQKFITETSYWSAQFDYDLDEYTTKATVALTIGFGLGIEHPIILGTLSVSGTIVGAILLDLCKHLEPKLPHEALIGCLYATSSAIALLILSYLPSLTRVQLLGK